METHADAALSPSPREPPVTTATLPLSEKSDLKSSSLASAILRRGRQARECK